METSVYGLNLTPIPTKNACSGLSYFGYRLARLREGIPMHSSLFHFENFEVLVYNGFSIRGAFNLFFG
jgi:hypothetical protein